MSESLFEHLAEVRRYFQTAPHLFLSLDFDGTLAPIVANPADAAMNPQMRSVLQTLSARPELTVAVVSGRSVADLRSRLGLNVILAGNHGLEICAGGWQFRQEEAERWQPLLRRICEEIGSRAATIAGSLIEDKGLTASVHFRNVELGDQARLRAIARGVLAAYSDRFAIRQGNKVLEILPRVDWHKGSAVLRILQKLRERVGESVACCAAGDDVTDEDLFRVLAGGVSIRVGPSVTTAARYHVRSPAEVCRFLNWVAAG